MSGNIHILKTELQTVRELDDFDLKMFLSEINDHGWKAARSLLPEIVKANKRLERCKETEH